jgi:hypothetical protein
MNLRAVASVGMLSLLSVTACLADAPVLRSTSVAWDAGREGARHVFGWRQGETVELEYALHTNQVPLDLSATNLAIVWDVVSATNLYQTWIAKTVDVVDPSGGVVRMGLDHEESILEPGQYYGFVRLLTLDGTNVSGRSVAVVQSLTVRYAPDERYTEYRGPLTYDPGELFGFITEELDPTFMDSVAAEITSNRLDQWDAAFVWGDHATAGYAPTARVAAAENRIDAVELWPTGEWSEAHSWGDHAAAGYAPTARVAAVESRIDAVELWPTGEWTEAHSWGDHADAGYMTNVYVVSVGGPYHPDWFTLSTQPYGYNVLSQIATQRFNSVLAVQVLRSTEPGYSLHPNILRMSAPDSDVQHVGAALLTVVYTNSTWVALWGDGVELGDTGTVVSTLGDFQRTTEIIYPGTTATWTNWTWGSDVAGSLRAMINTSAIAREATLPAKEVNVFSEGWILNTNLWAAAVDLSCASPSNTFSGRYRAGTLVTREHMLYATHYMAPVGTEFLFVDPTNGLHTRTLIDQRCVSASCTWTESDIAVARLDSPLPESIVPARVLDAEDLGRLQGYPGYLENSLIRLMWLNQNELLLPAATHSPASEWDAQFISVRTGAYGYPIPGDSGSPCFLIIGTNTVLLGTWTSPMVISSVTHVLAEIEDRIAALGGTHTNVNRVNLSAWQDYNAPPSP